MTYFGEIFQLTRHSKSECLEYEPVKNLRLFYLFIYKFHQHAYSQNDICNHTLNNLVRMLKLSSASSLIVVGITSPMRHQLYFKTFNCVIHKDSNVV